MNSSTIPCPSIPVITVETAKPSDYPSGWAAVWSDEHERAAIFCGGVQVTDWRYASTDGAQAVIERKLATPAPAPIFRTVRTMPDPEVVVTEFFLGNRDRLAYTRSGDIDADVDCLV